MDPSLSGAGRAAQTLQVVHKHPSWINRTLPVELNVVWNYGQNQSFYLQPNM